MNQSPKKSRTWCFTLNNYTESDLTYLNEKAVTVRYMIVGKEVGDAGTPHLQGYVSFKNAVRMVSVKLVVGLRAHVEIAKGTLEQNVKYCSKEGDYKEWGERPMFQSEKGAGEKRRYQEAWDIMRSEEGTLEEVAPDLRLRFYSTLKKVKIDAKLERKLTQTTEQHEWYYGPSGTGKSRKAREENPDAYLKNCNKWWDGYDDQDVVLVEDFDRRHDGLAHHLKIWSDRYPFNAEVKNAYAKIRPKKVIVTSNYHPKDIWTVKSDLEPILRRFKVTHFSSLGSVPIHPPSPSGSEENNNPPPPPQPEVVVAEGENAPEPQQEVIELDSESEDEDSETEEVEIDLTQ
ncbi:hypothetical protein N9Z56_01270 [bacterium]|nr:hypothetical protein [bacterium]